MVRKMKHTEIGDIPADWELQSFEETFKVLSNNSLSRDNLNFRTGVVRNIHYGDILTKFSEVLNCCEEEIPYVNDLALLTSSTQLLQDGDIIIADTAEDDTVGKVVEIQKIESGKLVSGLHTIPCRVKKGDFYPGYLGYYMNSRLYHGQVLPYVTGIKVSAISKTAIKDTLIVIPKIDEQRRIVQTLTDIDKVICELKQLIEKKRNVFEGIKFELTSGKQRVSDSGWQEYTVGNMVYFYNGLSGKSKQDFGSGNAFYITFLNVLGNTVLDTNAFEPVVINDGENQNLVKKGDLLFNISSETPEEVGLCAVVLDEIQNTYLNSFCFGLRICADDIEPLFMAYYFNSAEGRKIMRILAQGATRYNLSKDAFSETTIYIPEKDDQRIISDILRDSELELQSLEEKYLKYLSIKSGMMSKLFSSNNKI